MRGEDQKIAVAERNLEYDLWIIAAGRGTRMGNTTIPKCLIEIDGKSNLENTLDLIRHKFRKVFIVVAKEMEELVTETVTVWYVGLESTNIQIVGIESGGGDGKAVIDAFEKVTFEKFDVSPQAVILWGDAHIRSGDIVDEMFLKHDMFSHLQQPDRLSSMIIPSTLEHRPYVAINTMPATIQCTPLLYAVSADFIKYGEVRDEGWHDQSIFVVQWSIVLEALYAMRRVSMKRDCDGNVKFTTQSGELTFLNIIHYLFNAGYPALVYETKFPLMGYNTQAEVEKIKQSIKGN
jgi:hypothetical protein